MADQPDFPVSRRPVCKSRRSPSVCRATAPRHQHAYLFLLPLPRPGLLNSIAGLISTLINVYTAQKGHFSLTATVTTIVTGVCTAIFTALFFLYNNWVLEKVRQGHLREFNGERGVGVGEKDGDRSVV